MIRTYSPCWLIAILFTNSHDEKSCIMLTLRCCRTFQRDIEESVERFVCTFRLPYFHENSIYTVCLNEHTVPEKGLHCVGGCFFPIYKFTRRYGVATTELPDGYCQSKRKKSSNARFYITKILSIDRAEKLHKSRQPSTILKSIFFVLFTLNLRSSPRDRNYLRRV